MKKIRCIILILMISTIAGCGIKKENVNEKREKDISFSVICEDDAPEQLQKIIEEKKYSPFMITFRDGNDYYLLRGYGEQKSGGYSIQVKNLYTTKDNLVFETDFIGPSKEEEVTKAPSYPIIIAKTIWVDKAVLFE